MNEREPTKKFLSQIITQAGSITLEYFNKTLNIQEKTDNQGIVTEADLASEEYLKSEIHQKFTDHSILAEESGLTIFKDSEEKQPIWIIDPLDGTTNFSKGNPYYCISVAFGYLEHKRFVPKLSGIYQPTTNNLYIAEKNQGAYCNDQRISISALPNLKMASICTGFSSNKGEQLIPLTKTIAEIQNECLGLRINGAAALDLAHTAKGIFQGFYETPLAPWDTAAGILLITEAGGKVTNFYGEDFCPIHDRGIIAGNQILHDKLFNLIQLHYPNKNQL